MKDKLMKLVPQPHDHEDVPRASTHVLGAGMRDPFGRKIDYLRVSVTDRCDFRCSYCMSEDMNFLPKRDVLSLEEIDRLCAAFVTLGTRKIRLTGGEPLMRRNIMTLFYALSRHLASGALDELTLTTNGSQLSRFATELADCGVRRVNVSLDTLDPEKFRRVTRWGDLSKVLAGIDSAQRAGLKVKINTVALKNFNEAEFCSLISWANDRGMDLSIIEVMPLGSVDEHRHEQFLPVQRIRQALEMKWTLDDIALSTGGPARYVRIRETGGKVGFITPLTHNFCESCNRVRVTCTGTLFTCLGSEESTDLRAPLRSSEADKELCARIIDAIAHKPKGHDFMIDRSALRPKLERHMSVTGG